jgi:hypothetical protein
LRTAGPAQRALRDAMLPSVEPWARAVGDILAQPLQHDVSLLVPQPGLAPVLWLGFGVSIGVAWEF